MNTARINNMNNMNSMNNMNTSAYFFSVEFYFSYAYFAVEKTCEILS